MTSQTIDAAIIGDSHATILRQHLAPDFRFQASVTAPAKHFFGQFCSDEAGLHIVEGNLATQFPNLRPEQFTAMCNARDRLDGQLQPVLETGMTAVSTLGASTHRFCRTHRLAGASRKMLGAVVAEFCQHYLTFYRGLTAKCPEVYFIVGPARYVDGQQLAWQVYDDYMITQLTEMGVTIIDTRADTCDEQMCLRPEFAADDALHGNGAWNDVVRAHLAPHFPVLS